MRPLTRIQLARIHERSSLHRYDVGLHAFASCFHCLRTIGVPDIEEWTDHGLTALCPHCGIDAVLPAMYPHDVLKQMNKRYFRASRT